MRRDLVTMLVSHIDLDGYGCNIMAQRYLGMDIPIANVNYDELAETLMEIPRNRQVIITDISVPENLKGLLEEFEHIILIDHHKSTMWATEWGKDKDWAEVFVSTDRCATWWFYEYLAKQFGYRDDILDQWAVMVDDYDRYVLQYPESRRLNALFYISNRDRFVSDALRYTPKQVLDANRERVDRYLQQQEEYFERTTFFTLRNEEPKVLLFFAEKNKSYICEQVFKLDSGVGLLYGIDLHNMSVSLRSSPKYRIDCSEVAREIHPEGGGHRNASGASLKDRCKYWDAKVYEDAGMGEKIPVRRFLMDWSFLPKDKLPTYKEEEE